jgi:hypothetical protein
MLPELRPGWRQPRYSQGHMRLMGYGLFPKIYFLAQFQSARYVTSGATCPVAFLPILWWQVKGARLLLA